MCFLSMKTMNETMKTMKIWPGINHLVIEIGTKPVATSDNDFDFSIEEQQPKQRRKLTYDEVELWYYLRGTPDENGNPMGYEKKKKKLGVTIDDVKNAFKKYKRGKVW